MITFIEQLVANYVAYNANPIPICKRANVVGGWLIEFINCFIKIVDIMFYPTAIIL